MAIGVNRILLIIVAIGLITLAYIKRPQELPLGALESVQLADAQVVQLSEEKGAKLLTTKLDVSPLTDKITVQLKRPTTLEPLNWDKDSKVRVTIHYIVDGVDMKATGQTSGGIFTHPDGYDLEYYTFSYSPTTQYSNSKQVEMVNGKEYVKGVRIGETAKTEVAAYIELELLSGTVETKLTATTTSSEAGLKLKHNSVAYDADTSANDGGSGDGTVSFSHTPSTNDNLAAFLGVGNDGGISSPFTGTATYDGNAMTEMWDNTTTRGNAGYYKTGIDTSTVTVVSTLDSTDSFLEHIAGVVTMTGVDQTTPVGTDVLTTGTHTDTLTVTVSDAEADDLIVDFVMYVDDAQEDPIGSAGADQTEQFRENTGTPNNNNYGVSSTQSGDSDGVMSWSHTNNGNSSWAIGAVAFKSFSGATATYQQEGYRWRDDDGDEDGASWLADQDTDITRPDNTLTRLRVLLDTFDAPSTNSYQLEYKQDSGETWIVASTSYGGGTATIDSDSFEDQNFTSDQGGTWTFNQVTGTHSAEVDTEFANAGTYGMSFGNDDFAESNITLAVDTSGFTNIHFTFWWNEGGGWESGDLFEFAWSSDSGSTWRTEVSYDDPDTLGNTTEVGSLNSDAQDNPGFVVRFRIYNNTSGTAEDIGFDSFEIYGSASDKAIKLEDSANITASGEITTFQLTAPSGKDTGDFSTGRIQDDENPADATPIASGSYSEFEWAIIANPSVVSDDEIYEFRVTNNGTPFEILATPSWTIGTPAAAPSGGGQSEFWW